MRTESWCATWSRPLRRTARPLPCVFYCSHPGRCPLPINKSAHSSLAQRDEEVDVRKLQHRNPENLEEAEDLTTLSELNAPSILHTLASRYGKNRIYTYSGTVLISVNPYQRHPELYTRKVLESAVPTLSVRDS